MKNICIDPGHPSYFKETQKINWGCEDGGVKEVKLNLTLAVLLEKILQERGFFTTLTRHDNRKIISNENRAKIAKEFKADLFLRIHADSERHKDTKVKGVRTFYPPSTANNISAQSYEIALSIHREIIKKTKLVDRGVCDERVITQKNEFGMLTGTYWANQYKIPTILLETVYLSNPEDKQWILKPTNQELMMKAVAKGIEQYFKKDKIWRNIT